MTADYTPTTETLRNAWTLSRAGLDSPQATIDAHRAQFDRWLAAHDAVVAGFDAENWGIIYDGLGLELERSAGRFAVNPESQSSIRVTRIKALMQQITERAALTPTSEDPR